MKKIVIIFITLIFSCHNVQADNWCENLIALLSSYKDVDRTTAIKRDSKTHKITYATYDFKFESENLYQKVYKTVLQHSQQADYFSEKTQNPYVILIRFTDNNNTWSCRLSKSEDSQNQFLVTINTENTLSNSNTNSINDVNSHVSSATNSSTIISNSPNKSKSEVIKKHNQDMEQARLERERLLHKK